MDSRSLAVPWRATRRWRRTPGGALAAHWRAVSATAVAPVGHGLLRPGRRGRHRSTPRADAGAAAVPRHRAAVAGLERGRPGGDGAAPALGDGPDVLGARGRPTAPPAIVSQRAHPCTRRRRRAAPDLPAADPARTCAGAGLGAASRPPPDGALRNSCRDSPAIISFSP